MNLKNHWMDSNEIKLILEFFMKKIIFVAHHIIRYQFLPTKPKNDVSH